MRQSKQYAALADELREIPLEEIAERLGLERDRWDKHRWKVKNTFAISINGQKFYDHLAGKGGYGAIDLTLHVRGGEFKDALAWLSGRAAYAFTAGANSSRQPRRVVPRCSQIETSGKPPSCNVRDRSRWETVKRYLTQQRGLSEELVESLHQQGLIDADSRSNVMFFRYCLNSDWSRGEAIGALLRSTRGRFKGLTPGTRREDGYFWFELGVTQDKAALHPAEVAIAESPIDVVSYAILQRQRFSERLVYLSTDGTGAVPQEALSRAIQQGDRVIAAHDSDRAGEYLAWQLVQLFPQVVRRAPEYGKDWNEQLCSRLLSPKPLSSETSSAPEDWQRVAQAIGRSRRYLQRVEDVVREQQFLSQSAVAAMRQDFALYQYRQKQLWRWKEAALFLSRTEAYLGYLARVAVAFHAPVNPGPLTPAVLEAMEQDLALVSR